MHLGIKIYIGNTFAFTIVDTVWKPSLEFPACVIKDSKFAELELRFEDCSKFDGAV